jgi:hypothetical protein
MIPVKIQCGCGQRYAFDVEPVDDRMPSPVACPGCGADGTAAANEVIARALAAQPTVATSGRIKLRMQAPAASSVPPVAPSVASPGNSIQHGAGSGGTIPPSRGNVQKGRDGWKAEETSLNKLGTYIVVGPSSLAALLSWGVFGIQVPATILCIVVGVCGLVGGALNVAGRGPIVAGAFIGLLIGLGGYGATYGWIHNRASAYKFEVGIAFIVGAAPGLLLQYFLQRTLRKRAQSGA